MNEVEDILKHIDYPSFYKKHIEGLKLNGKDEVQCLCPFHDEKRKSFSLNLKTGLYFCHACGEKGNAIQFLEKKNGIDFKAALLRIKADEGIPDTKSSQKALKKVTAISGKKSAFLSYEQVKILHAQLLKNSVALDTLHKKYGLSKKTIERYLIGFQNDHFVIPLPLDGEKWTFKEHKGQQSKGSKVSLYPADVFKENLTYIIITEGEFKALLLCQMGFPAITGTGGANTWRREWNSFFLDLDVIVAYDNDEAGKRGALKVAGRLRGTAKTIKAIQWPSTMDSKDRKDVTDFFVTLGKTKEDFQRLLDNAQENFRDMKEINGIKFIEPEGFRITEDEVEILVGFENDDMINAKYKTLFYTPLFITGCALEPDTGTEEVKITFKHHRNWKSLWVPRRTIMDAKRFVELSDYGLSVNSVNVRKMIEYISAFEACNRDFIKLSYVVRGLGWKSVRNQKIYVLHGKVKSNKKKTAEPEEEPSIELVADAGFERFIRAMKSEGQYSRWCEIITEALKYPPALFAFYASFSAPLLRLLNAPNFIVDFWGQTSLGKTTVLELAASVWGNPHKEAGGLVFSWDSTKVFLERIAHFFCDAPIFPDDSQVVDDRTMTSMLYQIANGVGRGRGSVTGIRHNPTWHTVCYSSGERPLSQCTTFSGARARTIELFGSPFPNATASFINDLKQGLREHHGHAAPKFLQGILPLWENRDDRSRLKEEYKRYQHKLSLSISSEVGDRYSHYFSIVKVTADQVCRILKIGDPLKAEESISNIFSTLVNESLIDVDISARAMEYVLSWVSANESSFKSNEREDFGLLRDGEYVGIYPHKLAELLKKQGYYEKVILRGWAERKWITREDNRHFTCVKRVVVNGVSQRKRFIVIPWIVVERFLDG